MRFTPSEKDGADSTATPKLSGEGARSILQVPSLASTGGCSEPSGRSPADEEKKDDFSTSPGSHKSFGHTTAGWANAGGPMMAYRPDTASMGEAWNYFSESPPWLGASAAANMHQQPRIPYSPIRVRSGRGACRLPLNRNAIGAVGSTTSSRDGSPKSNRPSFPVSNRGKGKPGVRTNSIAQATEGITLARSASNGSTGDHSTAASTASVGSSAVAAAPDTPSRTAPDKQAPPRPILKRKLPMMTRKPSTDAADASSPTE